MLITFFFVTVALFMGVCCDLCLLALSPDRSLTFSLLWKNEHLFAHKVFPALRQHLGNALLWLGIVMFFTEDTFLLLLPQLAPSYPLNKFQTIWSAIFCIVVVLRVACTSFSFKRLVFLAPIFFVAWTIIISTPGSAYHGLIAQPMCLIIFFTCISLRPVMATAFCAKLLYMISTFSLYFAGKLPDHWGWLSDTNRMALGFGHFNVLGKAVVELLFLYMCLRFSCWRWRDTALCVVAAAFVWYVPRSRTAFFVILILLFLILLTQYFPKLFSLSWIQVLLSCSWSVFAVFSILASFYYPSFPFAEELNSLLSERLFLTHQQLLGPTTHLFGTVANGTLNWGNAMSISAWALDRQAGLYNYNLLDNGYVFCLYMAGPIWLTILCIGYGFLIWKYLRSNHEDWPLAILLLLLSLYTITEREFASTWGIILLSGLWCASPNSLVRPNP